MAPGEMTVIHEPGAITPVDSLREANLETGLGGRTLQALGEAQEINVVDGGEGSLRIDLEAARALMEAAGADPLLLPDTLDGRSVHVTVFPGIEQTWDDGITLVQSPSPFVDYPADVDPQVMGEAVLQVLGTEPREARRIARSIDWAGTLLMPIPSEMVTYHEVTVDGVSGVALEPLDGSNERALMWQKDGVIYLLTGEGSADELLDLVQSLN
jgi:hypothetical protein